MEPTVGLYTVLQGYLAQKKHPPPSGPYAYVPEMLTKVTRNVRGMRLKMKGDLTFRDLNALVMGSCVRRVRVYMDVHPCTHGGTALWIGPCPKNVCCPWNTLEGAGQFQKARESSRDCLVSWPISDHVDHVP